MVQPIMKDPVFLAQKSAQATKEDLPVSQDLLDTRRHGGKYDRGVKAHYRVR